MSRRLSYKELQAFESHLPEDLTTEQLDSIIVAAQYACEEAYTEGMMSTGVTFRLYRRAEK